jgi:hypothetical protein
LVFVNYCSKAHRPHECSHFGIPKNSQNGNTNSQNSQFGNTDSQDSQNSQDSQFPTGKNVLIPVIPNSQNSQNSQNSRTDSQVGIPNSHFSRRDSQIPKFSRRIPKKASLGDEDEPKSGSSWTGHLLLIGGLGLLATMIYFGLKASISDSTSNNSGTNSSSPPPSSNPYDFGAGDFGVKSLDELSRYNV